MTTESRTSKTRFFERWDGSLLIRQRHEAAVPEVFRGTSVGWEPFPQFDPMHKDEPIGTDSALELGKFNNDGDPVSMADLESPGDLSKTG